MKTKIMAAIAVVCICLSLFAACASSPEGQQPVAKEYNIIANGGEGYILDLPTKAKEGDTVSVKVTVTDQDTIVKSVKANGTECSAKGGGVYVFDMPSEDVAVTVETAKFVEDRQDGMLSMSDSVMTTVAKNATYPAAILPDGKWRLRVDVDSPYTTLFSSKSRVVSSNKDVVPDMAITVDALDGHDLGHGSSSSNVILAADICIDTSMVKTGSTWLTIYLKSDNTSDEGTLTVKITVVEYGEIQIETKEKQFIADVSTLNAEEGAKYTLRFYDNDYVDGGTEKRSFDIVGVVEDGKIKINFDYALLHKYSVSMSEGETYDYTKAIGFMNEVTGPSTSDLYDGYTEAGLMYVNKDSITLKVDVE